MSIRAKCLGCGKQIKAADDWVGRTGKCPACSAPVMFSKTTSKTQQADIATGNEEEIIWTGRPSQLVNTESYIVCGVLFWLIIPIFVAVWRWWEIKCLTFELTNQRLRVTHGVLSRRTDELELYRVKDTALAEPLFLRLFGMAEVHIVSSDMTTRVTRIVGIPLYQAKELRETIRNNVERLRAAKRVREIDYT